MGQLVRGEILDGLLDWRELGKFFFVGFGQESVAFELLLVATFHQFQLFLSYLVATFHRRVKKSRGLGVADQR